MEKKVYESIEIEIIVFPDEVQNLISSSSDYDSGEGGDDFWE